MSGFDENPFGEPIVDNPFADPAVQQVARSTNNQNNLEDYNPFANDNNRTNPPPRQQDQPAIVQPNQTSLTGALPFQQPQAQQSQNAAQLTQVTTAELQRRQEELERKAAELELREEALRNGGNTVRRNNWPPLPEKCCFQPCFYQDINVDIAPEFQRIVRHLYYLWGLYAITMALNVFGALLLMFTAGQFTMFGMALFYCFLFTPASFLCWYRPAYKAFATDTSANFMIFFFIFFFQMIVTVFQTIGLPDSGNCGFIVAIRQFSGTAGDIIVGIICLLIAISFGTCAAGCGFLLTRVHAIYRSTGASFAKAQAEFTNEFVRNPHVQQATANVTSAAINSQMSPRY